MPITKINTIGDKKLITTTLYEVVDGFVSDSVVPANYYEEHGKPFTFVIDTGATTSIINKEAVNLLTKPQLSTKAESIVTSMNGTQACNVCVNQPMSTGTFVYDMQFNVSDISSLTEKIKNVTGTEIHGWLGLDFLQANDCNIDLEKGILEIK